MNEDQNKNKLLSSSNKNVLRNSNMVGESFTQCDNIVSIPLIMRACLVRLNSVSDESIRVNKLTENNNVLQQIVRLNKSDCIKFPEENHEIFSALALKSAEADDIRRNNALLKEINYNLCKRNKLNREEKIALTKLKK